MLSLVIWYDILTLFHINLVSKYKQSECLDLSDATKMNKCLQLLKQYRDEGFTKALITAKDTDEKKNQPTVWNSPHKKKEEYVLIWQWRWCTNRSRNVIQNKCFLSYDEHHHKLNRDMLHTTSTINETWSFLYNMNKTNKTLSVPKVTRKIYTWSQSDILGLKLSWEIVCLKKFLDNEQSYPKAVLHMLTLNGWQNTFTIIWTALCIFETILVTVAKWEQSFSKLKLIKMYLRSTLVEDKLSDLALLSIENDTAQTLSYEVP